MRSLAVLAFATATATAQDAPKAPAATETPKPASPAPPIERLKLPAGFAVSVYAHPVPNARSMVRSAKGTLFVGSRAAKKVYAVIDADNDGKADKVITVASGLNSPNGVAVQAAEDRHRRDGPRGPHQRGRACHRRLVRGDRHRA